MYRNRLCVNVVAFILAASIVFPSISLAQSRSPVAPSRQQVETIVQEAFEKLRATRRARMPTIFLTWRKWTQSFSESRSLRLTTKS